MTESTRRIRGFAGSLSRWPLGGIAAATMALAAACNGGSSDPGPPDGEGPPFPPGDVFDGGGRGLVLGATVVAADPPPTVSGGTLEVLADGVTAIAADPDRDQVHIVNTASNAVVDAALPIGSEAGRVAEGPSGTVFVVLRRAGQIARVSTTDGAVSLMPVCDSPRGIAVEHDKLYVSCAAGAISQVDLSTGTVTPWATVSDGDLRDIVVTTNAVYVSRFRSAEVIVFNRDGTQRGRYAPPIWLDQRGVSFAPQVAWRLFASRDGTQVYMLHQHALASNTVFAGDGDGGMPEPLLVADGGGVDRGGYGGSDPIVHAAITRVTDPGPTPADTQVFHDPVLAVDATLSLDGTFAIGGPGNAHVPFAPQLLVGQNVNASQGAHEPPQAQLGEVVGIRALSNQSFVVQSREPAKLSVWSLGDGTVRGITISQVSRADTGHMAFHGNAGQGVACASCHPEGGDDGHVWPFFDIGSRRTQNLRGGVLANAPFHWDGSEHDFPTLFHDVFEQRMGGPTLQSEQIQATSHWVDRIQSMPVVAPADGAAVGRGRTLFEDASVGCSGCHGGARMSNNAVVDVGTGGRFRVPSLLGVRWRGPWMHNGCAQTLAGRFDPSCGGGDMHGHTSQLTAAQLADLISYLESL